MIDTIADQIADLYDNDGQNFHDADDIPMMETLDQSSAAVSEHNDHAVYTFQDKSVIVVNDSYWDTLTLLDGAEGWGLYGSSGNLYVRTDSRGVIDWYTRD
jgi:hypothetical protein